MHITNFLETSHFSDLFVKRYPFVFTNALFELSKTTQTKTLALFWRVWSWNKWLFLNVFFICSTYCTTDEKKKTTTTFVTEQIPPYIYLPHAYKNQWGLNGMILNSGKHSSEIYRLICVISYVLASYRDYIWNIGPVLRTLALCCQWIAIRIFGPIPHTHTKRDHQRVKRKPNAISLSTQFTNQTPNPNTPKHTNSHGERNHRLHTKPPTHTPTAA